LDAAVSAARARGQPIVALESSVFAQGLPEPHNREAARRMIAAIEARGAVAAITAVDRGVVVAGLSEAALERFLRRADIRKVSARDIPASILERADGATTVAAAIAIAHAAEISAFATGGIGGVHREPAYDESADLLELSRTPVIVVCAGAKSILNLSATWERLDSLGVPVVGYRTSDFPGFFCGVTGIRLGICVESPAEITKLWRAHRDLQRPQAMLVVQDPPPELALTADETERAVSAALDEARRRGIRGAALTPFLLESVTRFTNGASLALNVALLERNAALASAIATNAEGAP
jgi:pseudouridine-5'-phosphate glycosidase